MRGLRIWVHRGVLDIISSLNSFTTQQEEAYLQSGSVRLTTGELGSEIKWIVNSPCVSSLFKAMSWVSSAKAPFILRFYAIGWFEEVYREPAAAIRRIEQVLARGDRHFTSRVFIKESEGDNASMPEVMKDALVGQSISAEYSVDCSYDENNNMFKVERVGTQSAIGRVWGTYTSSHPCQSVGSYGDPVNETYLDVLKSNKPRYDHVLAALRLPDNALHWVPYHRVVYPRREGNKMQGVAVVSQIARVDITVL